jgi:serine/threonine-protein kinase
VPGYEVLEELGRGGMGAVLKGRDLDLGRDIAIKVLLQAHQGQTKLTQRFVEEARIAGQLQHPGVAPVYQMGRFDDGRPFFTMKLVNGHTLAQLLKKRASPKDDLTRFLLIFEQVCQTLAYAHARGVIHRDLKPANVMVGSFGEVQVMDWGLAKVLAPPDVQSGTADSPAASTLYTTRAPAAASWTDPGSVMGTPAYLAPEQARGATEDLDSRCDVFGLGAVLCDVLTGAPPFRGATSEDCRRQSARGELADAYCRLDACGSDIELTALAKRCLSAEACDRPADGGAVAAAIAAYRTGVDQRLRAAERERAAAEATSREERKRLRLALSLGSAVLLLAGLGGAAGWWYESDRRSRASAEAARTAELSAGVEIDLDETRRALAEGRWAVAKAATGRAEGRLGAGGQADLRERVRQAAADLRLVEALDEARLAGAATNVKESSFDAEATLAGYREALAAYGLDPVAADPERLGAAVRDSAVGPHLRAALEDWEGQTNDAEEREHLRAALAAAGEGAGPGEEWREVRDRGDVRGLLWLAAEAARQAEAGALPASAVDSMARDLLRRGARQFAARLLRAGLARNGSDFWLHHNLGMALMEGKQPDSAEAVRHLTAAAALRPDSPGVHINLGLALMELKRPAEAEKEYREALRLRPDYAVGHNNLGNALRALHRPTEAETEYREALRLRPDIPDAHLGLGIALADLKRLAEAAMEFREALRLRPEVPVAHNNLGAALMALRRPAEAEKEFREALRLRPDFSLAHNNLGNVLRDLKRLAEAEKEYCEALRLRPDFAEARYNLGNVLAGLSRLAEAEKEYREALRLRPDYPEAHVGLGNALSALNRPAEAEKEYRVALHLWPDFPVGHNNLGLALAKLNRPAEAEKEFREALRLRPDYPEARNGLGLALRAQNRPAEAEKEFREALRLRPDFLLAHNNLGILLQEGGRFSEAVGSLRLCHQLGLGIPAWDYRKSADLLQRAERRAALDGRLPAIREGKERPANAAEGVELAGLCQLPCKQLNAASVRFYAGAFAADPKLADDPALGNRYKAACAAALAGCGQGKDAHNLDAVERARLRQQGLDWLRDDLAAWKKRLDGGKPLDRAAAAKTLAHWQADAEFAGVRGDEALARLPAGERGAWAKLWSEVGALLAKIPAKAQ